MFSKDVVVSQVFSPFRIAGLMTLYEKTAIASNKRQKCQGDISGLAAPREALGVAQDLRVLRGTSEGNFAPVIARMRDTPRERQSRSFVATMLNFAGVRNRCRVRNPGAEGGVHHRGPGGIHGVLAARRRDREEEPLKTGLALMLVNVKYPLP